MNANPVNKKNGDNDTQLQMQERISLFFTFLFFLCQVTDITFWSVWRSICSPHACDKKKKQYKQNKPSKFSPQHLFFYQTSVLFRAGSSHVLHYFTL